MDMKGISHKVHLMTDSPFSVLESLQMQLNESNDPMADGEDAGLLPPLLPTAADAAEQTGVLLLETFVLSNNFCNSLRG